MKTIAHLADCHFTDGEKEERVWEAARSVGESIEKIKPDLIIIAGDLQHRRQVLDGKSAVNPLIQFLKFLGDIAPVIALYGNIEHDPEGSLEFIKTLRTNFPIWVYDKPCVAEIFEHEQIGDGGEIVRHPIGTEIKSAGQFLVSILPYPTKEIFLAGKEESSMAEVNQLVITEIEKLMLYYKAISQSNPKAISILCGHGNIDDAILENGQKIIGKDIVIPKAVIDESGCDIKCFGHIHLQQGYYCGSMYHINFGEPQPRTFRVYRIDEKTKEFTTENVPINATNISLHEVKYADGKLFDEKYSENDWLDANLRVRAYLTKDQREVITDEDISRMYQGYKTIDVERLTIAEFRARSATISKAVTLRDKIIEWGKVSGTEINDQVLEFADETEKANMQ
jgi:DNA repair exonuclease SbcCD nuclease subunit